jgi:hypothetical protein
MKIAARNTARKPATCPGRFARADCILYFTASNSAILMGSFQQMTGIKNPSKEVIARFGASDSVVCCHY